MPLHSLSTLTHLECSQCHKTYPHNKLQNTCPEDGKPLLARYDLKKAAATMTRDALSSRPMNIWRYAEVMPGDEPVTLGEGMTPILKASRLGEQMGLRKLFIKDEGLNPTGSFKARGLSAAVTRARALKAKALGHSDGRQRRRGARRLRGEGRHPRGNRNARRHAARQRARVHGLWRGCPQTRWPNLRLR